MVKVFFSCGHDQTVAGPDERPQCHCGETRIRKTEVSRLPRITGAVLAGPIATPTPVTPAGAKGVS